MKDTTVSELQEAVNAVFYDAFGRTPLRLRLKDINGEHSELQRWWDLRNLKEETGHLLASVLQLCNENEWDVEDVVREALATIEHRKQQYHTLGRKKNIAVYGGAFDPITRGHIEVCQYVLDVVEEFDEVWLMPCYQHMNNKAMVSAEMRLRMAHIASRRDGRIRISDYEVANKFAGDTFNLVTRLLDDPMMKDNFSFSFIIGLDNANTFHTWKNYADLERMIRFVVVPRAGHNRDPKVTWYQQRPHIDLTLCERKIVDTASSEVRRIFREKRDLDKLSALLDPQVLQFIKDTKLYKQPRL